MDGSRDPRAGTRRTVKVLRRFYEKNAPRSEERLGACPSSSGLARLQTHSPLGAASDAGGAAAATGTVTLSPLQPPKDLRLGRRELTVLLQDRPATDTGVQYSLPDIVAMRKCDLVRVLESVGQAVNKQRPTRLELLGGVVTLLCDMGRLEL